MDILLIVILLVILVIWVPPILYTLYMVVNIHKLHKEGEGMDYESRYYYWVDYYKNVICETKVL